MRRSGTLPSPDPVSCFTGQCLSTETEMSLTTDSQASSFKTRRRRGLTSHGKLVRRVTTVVMKVPRYPV